MAYADFLRAFAKLQGFANEQILLDNASRYGFHIDSRTRSRDWIKRTAPLIGRPWKGLRVLDVGCGYGAISVELAKLGASVAAIDINAKWLKLGEDNARNEAEVAFIKADASSRQMVKELQAHGPFDFVILKDVLQYVNDLTAVFENLARLVSPDAKVFYRVPNGRSIKSVLSDPNRDLYGLALLPIESWSMFEDSPGKFYVRRWELYRALFESFGYSTFDTTKNTDPDDETTRRHIVYGLRKIKQRLRAENFDKVEQLAMVRTAYKAYAAEVEDDLAELDWNAVFQKYRTQVWEGMLTHGAEAAARRPARMAAAGAAGS